VETKRVFRKKFNQNLKVGKTRLKRFVSGRKLSSAQGSKPGFLKSRSASGQTKLLGSQRENQRKPRVIPAALWKSA
jgi:hypothetical protein